MARGKSIESLRQELLASDPEFREAWEADRPKRNLAKALVWLRRLSGLTQSALADASGWDKAFVSRMEAASGGMPDTASIVRYCKACGADVGLILVKLDEDGQPHGTIVPMGEIGALQPILEAVQAQSGNMSVVQDVEASDPEYATAAATF